MKNEERFIKLYTQGMSNMVEIWVDKETGVNYLFRGYGYSGGLTVLVDEKGKPVVSDLKKLQECK